MNEDGDIEDRRAVELYRTIARERSVPACDDFILRYARAWRTNLFRRVGVPVAAAAVILIGLGAWQLHRDSGPDPVSARTRYAATTGEYLRTVQVAAAPSGVTQYLIGLQLGAAAAEPSVDQTHSSQ